MPRRPRARGREHRARAGAGSDLILLAFLALAAAGLIALVAHSFKQDGWLGLVVGRQIWTSGLPHHNTLTAIAAGTSWVDQQWLSHLAMYALYRLGGVSLLVLADGALMIAGIAMAAVAARRLGASPRGVQITLAATLPLSLVAQNVRAEAFAFPCFAATLYLLAADSRRPSRRVLWCIPLLVVWGNLHGSALLGAGLVSLRAICLAWEWRAKLRRSTRSWIRPLALLAAPSCLLVTPYGAAMISYYRSTVFSSAFRRLVTEWQPLTHSPVLAAYVLAMAALAGWAIWRAARRPTAWELLALLVLLIGAVDAVRNVAWLGLGALVLAAPYLEARAPRSIAASRRQLRVAALVALTACGAVAASVVTILSASRPPWDRAYPAGATATVKRIVAADPSIRIFSDLTFADWLIWRDPRLASHVAYDSRLELLSSPQLDGLHRFALGRHDDLARGYRLMVLDPTGASSLGPTVLARFSHEPGGRVMYRDAHVVVLLRRPQ